MALIRRVIYCEACGASVGLDEDQCPSCGSFFEPIIENPYKLRSGASNLYASDDSQNLKPYVDQFENFGYIRPVEIDELLAILRGIKEHEYPFRYYIIDLISLINFYRGMCMDHTEKSRTTQLEISKRLEAVHVALIK